MIVRQMCRVVPQSQHTKRYHKPLSIYLNCDLLKGLLRDHLVKAPSISFRFLDLLYHHIHSRSCLSVGSQNVPIWVATAGTTRYPLVFTLSVWATGSGPIQDVCHNQQPTSNVVTHLFAHRGCTSYPFHASLCSIIREDVCDSHSF